MNPYYRFIEGEGGEYLVAGPPGSGKTYWVVKQLERAFSEVLFDPTDITLASFTRTAAFELRKRIQAKGFEVPEENVGTLHSLAYRQLDKPLFACSKEHLQEWNRRHPQFALSPVIRMEELDGGEESEDQTPFRGDPFMRRYSHLMNAMQPIPEKDIHLTEFVRLWTEYKLEFGLVDFIDIIKDAAERTLPPSFGVLILDECQDFSPLELHLARQWAQHVNRTAYIGDDDQSIYSGLKGGRPDHWLIEVPEEQKLVLKESYRLPRAVHGYCMQLTRRITDGRWAKEFHPKVNEGKVTTTPASFQDPLPLLEVLHCNEQQGRSTMVLAYANHMLGPIIKALRSAGLMYHNPYRPTNGAWNPLGVKRKGTITSLERVCAFLRPEKTGVDILKFGPLLKAKGVFKHGMKARLEDELEAYKVATEDAPYDQDRVQFQDYFTPEATEAIERLDLDWFKANIKTTPALEYALELAARKGPEVEHQKPCIVIGTIHSVKGGEAEHVIVMPDVGRESLSQMNELHRVFYVACSRASDELTLGEAATPETYLWPRTSAYQQAS